MYDIYTKPEFWRQAYGNYLDNEPLRIENSHSRLDLCAPHIPQSGRLLDLGCATGFFASVAAEKGFDVVGVDLSPDMIEFGRRQYGIELRVGTVEGCDFPPDSFDIVSMWGLDCHFYDFRSTFQQIVGWLKPGGCLLFAYQDYSHWIRWLFPKIKREPNVYYGFTRDSFVRLMRQLGMQIVMHRTSVEVTRIQRLVTNLKLRLTVPVVGQAKVRIPTPSYLIVVARKEAHSV
jgi:SAM-dependent methyltransferase